MRAESKFRKQDEKMEKIVAKFLDETFYHEDTSVFVRNTNKELQIRGVDTIFTLNGTTYVCDEKSTAQYRDINTFTLELSFIDIYDHPSIGWLIDDDNVNNSYLLAWLDSDKVEVALVEKNTVLKHLESLGWTKERLFRKQEKIREAFDHGRFEPLGNLDRDGLKFHYSTNLVERPINVMLFRDTYRQLSVFNKCYLTKQFAKK